MTTFHYLNAEDDMTEDFQRLKNAHMNRVKYHKYAVRCLFLMMLVCSSAFVSYFITSSRSMNLASPKNIIVDHEEVEKDFLNIEENRTTFWFASVIFKYMTS